MYLTWSETQPYRQVFSQVKFTIAILKPLIKLINFRNDPKFLDRQANRADPDQTAHEPLLQEQSAQSTLFAFLSAGGITILLVKPLFSVLRLITTNLRIRKLRTNSTVPWMNKATRIYLGKHLEEQADQSLPCLLFHLHLLDKIFYGKTLLFEF